jgi:hypothetical protein
VRAHEAEAPTPAGHNHPAAGQSHDEIDQHIKRWRKEMAFAIAQHPRLVERARKLGIVLDEDDPGTTH